MPTKQSGKEADVQTNGRTFVCINCGSKSDKLYRDFNGGIIKISHCGVCSDIVDKYVEYDPVIIALDALLLKKQAFRHILINSNIKSPWKFCLTLLLCEAFTKYVQERSADPDRKWKPDHVIYSALEFDLYRNFMIATSELAICVLGVMFWLLVWWKLFLRHGVEKPRLNDCGSGLILSNFGMILVVPTLLWGQTYRSVSLLSSRVFTFAANLQAMRVLYPAWNSSVLTLAVFCGHFLSLMLIPWTLAWIQAVT